MNSSLSKKSKAGCFRRLKRRFREKVDWNNWSLKAQLRTHLTSIVLAFFIGHFIFLILSTWYQYQSSVISHVHDSLLNIFSTKLNYTSDAITLCYQQNENSDVDSIKRLQNIVSDYNKYPFRLSSKSKPSTTKSKPSSTKSRVATRLTSLNDLYLR